VKRALNQTSYQFSEPATAALVLLVAVVACEAGPAKSNEKILTQKIAEQFLENVNSVELSEFTAIEDAAAESLSKHEGWLSLNGLTSLSDAAAESLSKCEGILSLNGLTSLSDAAAESLSKCEGILFLSGLTSLSDAAAESLSKHKGHFWLSLDNIPESAATILRQHPSFAEED
jgi:hypothetical protein